jgi:hypothetical protein
VQPATARAAPRLPALVQAGGSGSGPDIFTDTFKPVQDTQPARREHVFVGFTQGVEYSESSASTEGSATYTDGGYSSGGESLYSLHQEELGGFQQNSPAQDSLGPPARPAVYMAKAADVPDPAAGAGASNVVSRVSPAQALVGLATTLTTLLATQVTAENQAELNAEIARIKDQMTQAQASIDAKNVRLATREWEIQQETTRLQHESYHLEQRRAESDAVHHRRHRSRYTSNVESQALQFSTPPGERIRGPATGTPQMPPDPGAHRLG